MKKIQSEIIEIHLDSASFKGTGTIINPTYINFFFGNNGSGKSTIAKAIQSGLGITYAPGKKHTDFLPLIYNQDFIDKNMRNYHNLRGIFTFNETNIDIQNKIDEKERQINSTKKIIDEHRVKQQRLHAQIKKDKKMFHQICWDKSLFSIFEVVYA